MRLVIQEKTPDAFINIEEISNESIVGVEFDNGRRCAVIQEDYNTWTSVGADLSTLNTWAARGVYEYVREAMTMKGTSVYVFNTSQELFKWMSEGK